MNKLYKRFGDYAVSNDGTVVSLKTGKELKHQNGYGHVSTARLTLTFNFRGYRWTQGMLIPTLVDMLYGTLDYIPEEMYGTVATQRSYRGKGHYAEPIYTEFITNDEPQTLTKLMEDHNNG